MTTNSKPSSTRRFPRFGISTMLLLMTLLATLIASETQRRRHRRVIEDSFAHRFSEYIRCSPRFEGIDANGVFARNANRVCGSGWNEVVTSLAISNREMSKPVFDSVTQLKHVRTLGFRRVELTEHQIVQLMGMKSLRWLYFLDSPIQSTTLDRLREALPNTFVNSLRDD